MTAPLPPPQPLSEPLNRRGPLPTGTQLVDTKRLASGTHVDTKGVPTPAMKIRLYIDLGHSVKERKLRTDVVFNGHRGVRLKGLTGSFSCPLSEHMDKGEETGKKRHVQ